MNSEQLRLVKRIMADGGYTRENFAELVQSTIGAEMIIAKQSDLRTCLDTLTFDLILVKLDQKQEFLIHEKLCTPL
ncbi:hypothetical protein LA430_15020 [Lactiplantibacillus plantarum]|uniref:hypothetical protein n=1 Tax=Lactiplantibacillus plantarum TaxID=1590 RepID=UPI001E3147C3|nr:hypothetical protein [Lactiplantibacillus plantarum]MCC6117800.1 hypothetical protein [Lactiplantibacillus plantarum]MCW6115347.1 hypothetical protein [Lactiplantibacillus plantarum]